MFVSEAHSVTQQSRLALTLAWVAGYTNAATIICSGVVTSHVSGTTSNLGIEIALRQWSLAFISLFIIGCFWCGSFLAGIATEVGQSKSWRSIYVLPIAIEAILLGILALLIEFTPPIELQRGMAQLFVIALGAAAMGLQNATITRISSGVVRTTHVTGVLTDLGMESGQLLFHRRTSHHHHAPLSVTRLLLLAGILGSFAFGAGLGTLSHEAFPRFTMFPPVLFLLGVILIDLQRPIAELEQVALQPRDGNHEPFQNTAIYKLLPDSAQREGKHRLPHLLSWARGVGSTATRVILDVSSAPDLDENSLQSLSHIADWFNRSNRALIIVGLAADDAAYIRQHRELHHRSPLTIAATVADALVE